jgi:hypothetical protein
MCPEFFSGLTGDAGTMPRWYEESALGLGQNGKERYENKMVARERFGRFNFCGSSIWTDIGLHWHTTSTDTV